LKKTIYLFSHRHVGGGISWLHQLCDASQVVHGGDLDLRVWRLSRVDHEPENHGHLVGVRKRLSANENKKCFIIQK